VALKAAVVELTEAKALFGKAQMEMYMLLATKGLALQELGTTTV
jgi:hypothetical protein